MDYATPIAEPILKRYISGHRLSRQRPLTYYVDRGTPEPVCSAPLDGARWWSEAFTAAGWPDGFRVEVMPEDAGPMDVRYNVIQWVHRSTRGWPYGGGVTDPRTGEIIQGRVTLGSLRVRQDYLIAEGLLAPHEAGKPVNPAMEKMTLQRLRQLAAHEVGHTLVLMHNYVSSAQGCTSVMDYPYPLATLPGDSGAPELKDFSTNGIGEWDKVAIACVSVSGRWRADCSVTKSTSNCASVVSAWFQRRSSSAPTIRLAGSTASYWPRARVTS